jgi:hypothetical protein
MTGSCHGILSDHRNKLLTVVGFRAESRSIGFGATTWRTPHWQIVHWRQMHRARVADVGTSRTMLDSRGVEAVPAHLHGLLKPYDCLDAASIWTGFAAREAWKRRQLL